MDPNTFNWRQYDRRLFAAVALVFPLTVLLGFARTYYLKAAFGTPALSRPLVHVHGALMTTWVAFFIAQVWLIRSKNHRTHMKFGMLGIVLAIAIVIVGLFTAVAAAKYGATTPTPAGIPPLSFLAIPVFDLVMFAGLFAAAIYFRDRPAEHKRLMLLTAINFSPAAVARFPFEPFVSGGPLVFFGIPSVVAIILVALDAWKNGKLNKVFLIGTIVLIASYPLRIIFSGTDVWTSFAAWLTNWAA